MFWPGKKAIYGIDREEIWIRATVPVNFNTTVLASTKIVAIKVKMHLLSPLPKRILTGLWN